MKIAFLGPYKDGTGYSNACIEYIMSMNDIGLDVVPRSVKMTNTIGEYPKIIDELAKKSLNDIDVVFSYNLPSEFSYKHGIMNVGGFAYETNGWPNSTWQQNIDIMDKIIAPSRYQLSNIKHNNAHCIPHAIDTEKFMQGSEFLELGASENTLVFYTVSEYNKRKNVQSIVAAYSCAFDATDDVSLVLKVHVPGKNPQESSRIVKEMIRDVRMGLKRFSNLERYPKIVLITNYLKDEQINAIHSNCDVFVSASYGEGFCIPAADALGHGNLLILPNSTSFKDFLDLDPTALRTECTKTRCCGSLDSLPYLYTGDEYWYTVSTDALCNNMKFAYKNQKDIVQNTDLRADRYFTVVSNFSRRVIGNKLKELFNV